jgi:hypothetical protein
MANQFNTTTLLSDQVARDRLAKRLAPLAARYSAAVDRRDEVGASAVVADLHRLSLCRTLDGYAIVLGMMISLVGAYAPAAAAMTA